MQKSYTDCAVHIVCIFGLTEEVFSETLVSGNCKPDNQNNQTLPKHEKFQKIHS